MASLLPSEKYVQPKASAGFNLYYSTQGGQQGTGNVAPVTTAKELKEVMQAAVNDGRSFSVVAGGHGYEGRAAPLPQIAKHIEFGTSKEIVIDQSLMNKIGEVTGENPNSPETTYITMEGGLQLATAYEYLFKKHNLLIPGGSCWSVCAGGHVTGGGYGIYSRDHGTTCDFLAGVHFAWVDSTGQVQETHAWVNSKEEKLRQLLWACRGAMAGNFGVILKYYFDLPKLAKLCKAPETYYNLWITPAAIGTKYCTCTMYKALFRANYEWFRDEGKAFSYFRATTHGITMNLYCCTKMGDLLEYLAHICRAMIEVEKESYKGIMVHPYGGPHASPTNGRLLFADHAAKDKPQDTVQSLMSTFGQQILAYSFFDFMEANSGIPTPNSFFKNSGHVIGAPRSHEVSDASGKSLYELGYTDAQLEIIFDRILQLYTAEDHKGNLYTAANSDVTLTVYDNVTLKSKELYLKKFSPDDKEWKHVAKSDIDARPQSGFISQHFAAGGASSGPAPADANQNFTWQHDPYNGKVKEWASNETSPVPIQGEWKLPATSIANRNAVMKVQPQLYWSYEKDSPYFHKWFDSFTAEVFSGCDAEHPQFQGGYINYPDTYLKTLCPEDANLPLSRAGPDAWPHLMYGNGNGIDSVNPSERAHGMPADFLKPLVEVKGMFDSKGYFDLYSRAARNHPPTWSAHLPLHPRRRPRR